MPVESATFITDLVPANPVHTDGLNQSDAHERLVKQVLQNSFPGVNAAVTATPAALNRVSTRAATVGVDIVEPASATVGASVELLPPNSSGGTVSLANAAAASATGIFAVDIGDATNSNPHGVLTVDYLGNASALATFNAPAILQAGVPLLPRGVVVMWGGLVSSIPAGWLLCDGTNGTSDLRGMFIVGAGGAGALYGPGSTGGSSGVGAATSSAGAHTHTGSTNNAGGHAHSAGSDVQGVHNHTGNTDQHALTVGEMPSHNHSIGIDPLGGGGGGFSVVDAGSGSFSATAFNGGGLGHSHPIELDGAHGHNITVNAVGDHAHGISVDGTHSHTVVAPLPPYFALCFIMKS